MSSPTTTDLLAQCPQGTTTIMMIDFNQVPVAGIASCPVNSVAKRHAHQTEKQVIGVCGGDLEVGRLDEVHMGVWPQVQHRGEIRVYAGVICEITSSQSSHRKAYGNLGVLAVLGTLVYGASVRPEFETGDHQVVGRMCVPVRQLLSILDLNRWRTFRFPLVRNDPPWLKPLQSLRLCVVPGTLGPRRGASSAARACGVAHQIASGAFPTMPLLAHLAHQPTANFRGNQCCACSCEPRLKI